MLSRFCTNRGNFQKTSEFINQLKQIITMELKKAVKKQVKLRLGISAVSGGGKTYSALLLAYGMTNDWTKIAVIDTENESASLYSDLGDYNVLSLSAPYSPERYIEAIHTCENAGIEVCIIDSIAHEWEGEGGVLNLCDTIGGGFQSAWKQLTPRHDKFKNTILNSKMHIITTVRRKQEYILVEEQNKQGRMVQKPVKAGMKEITREGWEYELTINFELDLKHNVSVSKDRTNLFIDKPTFVITPETGRQLMEWCNNGVNEMEESERALRECKTLDELKNVFTGLPKNIGSQLIGGKDEIKAELTPKKEAE